MLEPELTNVVFAMPKPKRGKRTRECVQKAYEQRATKNVQLSCLVYNVISIY